MADSEDSEDEWNYYPNKDKEQQQQQQPVTASEEAVVKQPEATQFDSNYLEDSSSEADKQRQEAPTPKLTDEDVN